MDSLSNMLYNMNSVEKPNSYEFYEIKSDFPNERLFVIQDIITNKTILVKNYQNRIEIDKNYNMNSNNMTKISIIDFFQRLNGVGVSYITK